MEQFTHGTAQSTGTQTQNTNITGSPDIDQIVREALRNAASSHREIHQPSSNEDRVTVSSPKTRGTQTRDTIGAESSDIDQMVSQALCNAATRILKIAGEEMLALETRMKLSAIQAERPRL